MCETGQINNQSTGWEASPAIGYKEAWSFRERARFGDRRCTPLPRMTEIPS